MTVGEVSAAGHLGLRRADHGHRRAPQGVFDARSRHGRVRPRSRDLVRRLRGGRRGRRRDGRRDGAEHGAGLRRRARDQPDARRGPDRGRRDDGPRPRAARAVLPALPEHRGPRRRVRRLPHARAAGLPGDHLGDRREPVGRRPVRRQGDRRDGQQRAGPGDLLGDLRRRRRLGAAAAGHAGAGAARPAGQGGRHATRRAATARR